MGVVSGKIVSGRIDRLIVEPGRVVIVDFKTNRPAAACPAEVPEIYRRQLAAYRSLLERIYPDKKNYLSDSVDKYRPADGGGINLGKFRGCFYIINL